MRDRFPWDGDTGAHPSIQRLNRFCPWGALSGTVPADAYRTMVRHKMESSEDQC